MNNPINGWESTIMKTKTILAAALFSALAIATAGARAEDITTRIGTLSTRGSGRNR